MSHTEHVLNLPTSHCFICSAGLKPKAHFCSHCGQPVIVATRADLEATTRRLTMPNLVGGALTRPLNKPKARTRSLLALSLAANCLLVMAFAAAAINYSAPRAEMVRLVTKYTAPDDPHIFIDANDAREHSSLESLSDVEESLSAAFTPSLETGCLSPTEPDTPRRVERSVPARARRVIARTERKAGAVRNARRSEQITTSNIRLVAEREMSEAADELTFEMRLLPFMIKTAFDKAHIEAGKARNKSAREVRKRNLLPPARSSDISAICTPADTPAEAPTPLPPFVIKTVALEEIGL